MAKTRKKGGAMPDHVGLIPDGNRRWSRANGTRIFNAYDLGIKKFVSFSVWLQGFGVRTLTVWALSTENLKRRNSGELRVLYNLYIKAAKDPAILKMLDDNQARVRVIGLLHLLPKKVCDALQSVERRTQNYTKFTINLLVAYGGRYDMLAAANSLRGTDAEFGEEELGKRLVTASIPNLDMVIRTSGERRLSGFLPWQSDYSELYFSKKYWPDFSKRDLARALETFSSRERRFGR